MYCLFKPFIFLSFHLILICTTNIHAQEAIPCAGGNALGSEGSVSYTIGQIVYTTSYGTTGSVAQGVQQAYTITIETGIYRAPYISLTCTAYPNPTNDFLTLKLNEVVNAKLIASLYDLNGRPIKTIIPVELETVIPMESYEAGTYLLKVMQAKDASFIDIKTFKIIKK